VTPPADAVARPSIEARLRAAGLLPLDRPAWLEVDTAALGRAVHAIRGRVGAATEVWPVVKDDAYGHGIEVATRSFRAAGAAGVCVATLGEAQAIRAAGIAVPVLILYPVADAALAEAMRAGFAISVATSEGAEAVARAWSGLGAAAGTARLAVHVEVETGFTRMGIPAARLRSALELLGRPGIEVVALWSHLSTPEDDRVADDQEERLADAVRMAGVDGIGTHLAASGGLLTKRGIDRTLVRPGLVAYGVAPGGPLGDRPEARWLGDEVRPALRLLAHAIRIEEVPAGTSVGYGGTWVASRASCIATLPVGYGDGYSRALSGADVLVHGRRAPVVGVVSMDSCTVDVTDVQGVGPDDEFVLLGSQGGDSITALALAQRRTTIPWEVLAGMARRLTRVYDAPAGPMGVRTLAGETLVR
jgi:alanine racemase